MKRVLVTGTAGFIGHHLAIKLAETGFDVTGVDNLNDYYAPSLKYDRLKEQGIEVENIGYGIPVLSDKYRIKFIQSNLEDADNMTAIFEAGQFEAVVNLAAQAGVRYSLENPKVYVTSNIIGFFNILESCRNYKIKHLVFASSSSVYGLNKSIPFKESDHTDHQVSLYAASKKSNEVMAHSYAHLFRIPITGLRFFTVYGPWGRPDMAIYLFTKAILKGEPIKVFNYGNMKRDFTYVDDVVNGIKLSLENPPEPSEFDAVHPDPSISSAPFRLFNIGNSKPISLLDFINAIEEAAGCKAHLELLPIQPGDVEETYASTEKLSKLGYSADTDVKEGVTNFLNWYRNYYKEVLVSE